MSSRCHGKGEGLFSSGVGLWGRFNQEGNARNGGIEHVWVEICPIWPFNGAQFRVHPNLIEKCRHAKWGKYPFKRNKFAEADLPFKPVLKAQPEPVVLQGEL